MITCRLVVQRLGDLVEGQVPSESRDLVEGHLEGCPSCRAYLAGYRLTIHLSRRLPCPPLPPGLAGRLDILLREWKEGKF
jgi:anti-sigma factor RsiW